jgi:hypothetical protein
MQRLLCRAENGFAQYEGSQALRTGPNLAYCICRGERITAMTLTSKFDKIHQRAAMVAPMPITLVDSDLRRRLARNQRASTRLVDETLEDSFPGQ